MTLLPCCREPPLLILAGAGRIVLVFCRRRGKRRRLRSAADFEHHPVPGPGIAPRPVMGRSFRLLPAAGSGTLGDSASISHPIVPTFVPIREVTHDASLHTGPGGRPARREHD